MRADCSERAGKVVTVFGESRNFVEGSTAFKTMHGRGLLNAVLHKLVQAGECIGEDVCSLMPIDAKP